MRIAKNILLTIGILLIVLNVLAYFGGLNPFDKSKAQGLTNKVAYFIGTNLFLIVGSILLLIAYFLSKKMKRRKEKALVDSLFKDIV